MPIPFNQSDSLVATERERKLVPVQGATIFRRVRPLVMARPHRRSHRRITLKTATGMSECVGREGLHIDALALPQGAVSGVLERPGKTGPFISFPAVSHPTCQLIPSNPPRKRPR